LSTSTLQPRHTISMDSRKRQRSRRTSLVSLVATKKEERRTPKKSTRRKSAPALGITAKSTALGKQKRVLSTHLTTAKSTALGKQKRVGLTIARGRQKLMVRKWESRKPGRGGGGLRSSSFQQCLDSCPPLLSSENAASKFPTSWRSFCLCLAR
jgi:hypothetical protein